MKINTKIFFLFALIFFLSCIAPVTVFAEEYVLGKKYYKKKTEMKSTTRVSLDMNNGMSTMQTEI